MDSPDHRPTRPEHLRQANRALVLAEIRRRPGISRRELARLIHLTEGSLSRIARDLIDSGLVCEFDGDERQQQRGRPSVGLVMNATAHYIVSISLTPTEQKLSVVDIAGARLFEQDIAIPAGDPVAAIVQAVSAGLRAAREGPDLRLRRPLGVMIARSLTIPGLDVSRMFVGNKIAVDGLNLPISFVNVTSALHAVETHDLPRGLPFSSMLLYCGLDLDASLIVDGRVREPDHDLDRVGGLPIAAGGGGGSSPAPGLTLGSVSSGRAVLIRLGASVPEMKQAANALASLLPHAVRRANAGDPPAVAVFRNAGTQLALSYAATSRLLPLHRIVLAGPMVAARPFHEAFGNVFESSEDVGLGRSLQISRTNANYLQAAEFAALNHFVFAQEAAAASMQTVREKPDKP